MQVEIPDMIDGLPVTGIQSNFDDNINTYNKAKITKITISSGLTIQNTAFQNLSKLEEVNFKNVSGTFKIGKNVFPSNLKKITFSADTTCKVLREYRVFPNKKRRYRILRKRRFEDMVFVF